MNYGIIFQSPGKARVQQGEEKMVKSFTKEEKDKIDSLYRKDGWAIKKIARHLKVSDKRVSAYIKGMMEDKPIDSCGKSECRKKIEANKGEFISFTKEMVHNHAESCYRFVDAFNSFILDVVIEIFTEEKLPKKEIKKRCAERLNKLFKATMDVTLAAGCSAILTMPPECKKGWLENLRTNPLRCIMRAHNKKSNKGNK